MAKLRFVVTTVQDLINLEEVCMKLARDFIEGSKVSETLTFAFEKNPNQLKSDFRVLVRGCVSDEKIFSQTSKWYAIPEGTKLTDLVQYFAYRIGQYALLAGWALDKDDGVRMPDHCFFLYLYKKPPTPTIDDSSPAGSGCFPSH